MKPRTRLLTQCFNNLLRINNCELRGGMLCILGRKHSKCFLLLHWVSPIQIAPSATKSVFGFCARWKLFGCEAFLTPSCTTQYKHAQQVGKVPRTQRELRLANGNTKASALGSRQERKCEDARPTFALVSASRTRLSAAACSVLTGESMPWMKTWRQNEG